MINLSEQPNLETPVQEELELEPPPLPANPKLEAAKWLQGAIPAFKNHLDKVTGTQCKAVLSALTEAPLSEQQPKFTTKEALQLYELGLAITNSKFILFQTALKDEKEEEIMMIANKIHEGEDKQETKEE